MAASPWISLYKIALLSAPAEFLEASRAAKEAIQERLMSIGSGPVIQKESNERQRLLLAQSDLNVITIALVRVRTRAGGEAVLEDMRGV